MVDNIKISYHNNGVITTMELADDYSDNLPYVLADIFRRLIEDSNANPEIVINELQDSFPINE
jgi:hypothetical protein